MSKLSDKLSEKPCFKQTQSCLKRCVFISLVASSACFAMACGDNGTNNAGECAVDADCAARTDGNVVCDVENKQCVKPDVNCTTDEECAGNQDGRTKCNAEIGFCVSPEIPCTSDDDCAVRADGSTTCDTASGTCVKPGAGCTSDAECADNEDGKTECDTASGACVVPSNTGCKSDYDCKDEADGKTKCDTLSGLCIVPPVEDVSVVECERLSDCASNTNGKIECDFLINECVKPSSICGNGVVEGNEVCDMADLNGMTCQSLPKFVAGSLSCNSGCALDTSACLQCTDTDASLCAAGQVCKNGICTDPEHVITCGDKLVEGSEQCDSTNLNGKSCGDVVADKKAGKLACSSDCRFDTSNCVECTSNADCIGKGAKTLCSRGSCTEPTTPPSSSSDAIVISQIYTAGATEGAAYAAKFVELFNRSTTDVTLSETSIQYSAKAGTNISTSCILPANLKIPANSYYLVSLTGGASMTPAADFTCAKTIAASSEAGKIYLVGSAQNLSTISPSKTQYIDAIGYGSNTNWGEGNAPTENLSKIKAALRKNGGCIDTDNNKNDFEIAAPSPRNSASPKHSCGSSEPPATQVECSSDNDCAKRTDGKSECNLNLFVCVKPTDCDYDSDCAYRSDGKTACNGVCQKPIPCTSTKDCASNKDGLTSCLLSGKHCAAPDKCNRDSDCSAGRECNLWGKCELKFDGCDSSEDCGHAYHPYCNTAAHECVECMTNLHCRESQACVNHECVAAQNCGNGQIDQGEVCDGSALNGSTCASVKGAGYTGTLSCNLTCKSFNTSKCVKCGNGVLESGEVCESTNLNGKTCESFGYKSGTLKCSSSCEFDASDCSMDECRNGDEECADNNRALKTCVNGRWETKECPADKPYCGKNNGLCTVLVTSGSQTCDQKTFHPICVNDKLYYCVAHKYSYSYGTYYSSYLAEVNATCGAESKIDNYQGGDLEDCNTKDETRVLSIRGSEYVCQKCLVSKDNELKWYTVPGEVVNSYTCEF